MGLPNPDFFPVVSKVALLQTGIFCALWWQIFAELITSQKTNLIMSVERDTKSTSVDWKGKEFKKLSGMRHIHKQRDILTCFFGFFFVLTQVNESKNIWLDRTFYEV